ncbi:lanthionine synthetase C family protein (plasmid) [Streptomyces sp. Qhu-G9]|uniref:lanthionine synthetase C family protein n=1 Tax=Streptomyces sp. Qhu-G9 TaxID=3452799 RepID=UPI0022AC8404|nr:lanthionine synthetase C family protein [Streptomyces aurantiacus]WAU78315.1 lanthionine synthetase C family protein [Streptomyces aurantiacus]
MNRPNDEAPGWGQSLYYGAAGITLMHAATAARTDASGTQTMQPWATAMLRSPIVATEATSLYEGAPAVAYVLTFLNSPAAARRLAELDGHVRRLTAQRLDRAHARIDRAALADTSEFDLISGLTGLGVYHLRKNNKTEVRDILTYLIRLTEPITAQRQTLPGWWSTGSIRTPRPEDTGGHGNFGIAHGIAGPLALLATTARHGYTAPGHKSAITRICHWLDQWQIGLREDARWPEWISRAELRRGQSKQTNPRRPSWCYGTPGIARAQQLAGLALGDTAIQDQAGLALAGCLRNEHQLALLTDASLCHGWAGLLQVTRRAAHDEKGGQLSELLPRVQAGAVAHLKRHGMPDSPGLMEGNAGPLLIRPDRNSATPDTSWDLCLLLSG